jgi:O-antigen biosynthesis protein
VRASRSPEPPECVEQQLRDELRARDEVIAGLRAALAARQDALAAIESSLGWKLVRRSRTWRDRLFARFPRVRAVLTAARAEAGGDMQDAMYARWVDVHTPTADALGAMKVEARRADRPVFSIVLRSPTTDRALLSRSLRGIASQVWDRWELVLPPSDPAAGIHELVAAAIRDERRVRVAPALTDADAAATGDYVVFLSPGDELAPEALYRIASAIGSAPEADVIYSDEDESDAAGRRTAPVFKPDWSPHLLMSSNYLGQLVAYRRRLLRDVGVAGAGFAADPYDVALRATERATLILHVPEVLCHRCRGRRLDDEHDRGQGALESALSRRGLPGCVERAPGPAAYRVRYAIRGTPLVSIIIPSKNHASLLRACVTSIEARSTWANRALIIVDNGSTRRSAVRLAEALARRHEVMRDGRPFNWAALNNAAAARAKGEYLLFMNDDTEVLSQGWIEALLEQAQLDDVGAVGGKLLYPNGTVQHAGIVLGIGVAGHVFRGLPGDAPGYQGLATSVRDVSAVTGACLMVRRSVFEALGGFDERLPVAYNDVDFCLRLRAKGLAVVWTPHAKLLHRESATRGTLDPPAAQALMWERWCTALARDPFYSQHLTLSREDYSLRVSVRAPSGRGCE